LGARRMSFKKLSDGMRAAALPDFLSIALGMDGLAVTFAVDARIGDMFAAPFLALVAEWPELGQIKRTVLERLLRIVHFGALTIGIFLAPMIAGREPRHQSTLTLVLFGALVLVVAGSLAGELLSYRDVIRSAVTAWWLGAQGWEYLDLGRLWQIALTAGLLLWLVIIFRGLAVTLRGQHRGSLPWLFFYASLSIPLFYGVGMLFGPKSHFAVIDFWRFWVVHLWVEDFLEIFTTVTVAYMFVLLGLVPERAATRLIYLEVILYSIGGVVGTMHHLYFSGTPAIHMALGAFFSAMEVVPLVLLTFEAWRFMRPWANTTTASPGRTPPDSAPLIPVDAISASMSACSSVTPSGITARFACA
jgi:nitric oxide reductase subunit B